MSGQKYRGYDKSSVEFAVDEILDMIDGELSKKGQSELGEVYALQTIKEMIESEFYDLV